MKLQETLLFLLKEIRILCAVFFIPPLNLGGIGMKTLKANIFQCSYLIKRTKSFNKKKIL